MNALKTYTKTERKHLFKIICSLYTDPDRSLQAACNEVNVPAGDFHNWVSRIAEFAAAYESAKIERATIQRNRLLAAARAGLKELATGRIVELKETTTDGAGNVVSVVTRQKFYPPDPSICLAFATSETKPAPDKMTYNNIDDLLAALANAITDNREQLTLTAAKAAEAALKERVFNNGQAADGSRIGSYSTELGRYGARAFAVKSKFKPNPNRRTVTLPDGYSELRSLNGRQTGYVDPQYTGSLLLSIKTTATGDGHAVAITNDREAAIADRNERRFGKTIFAAGNVETEAMQQAIELELQAIFELL